jgi:hypothetical protein
MDDKLRVVLRSQSRKTAVLSLFRLTDQRVKRKNIYSTAAFVVSLPMKNLGLT